MKMLIVLCLFSFMSSVFAQSAEQLKANMDKADQELQLAYKRQRDLGGMQGDLADNVDSLVKEKLAQWQQAKRAYEESLKPVSVETLKQQMDQKNKELQDIYKKMDQADKFGDFETYDKLNAQSKNKLSEFRTAELAYNNAVKAKTSPKPAGPPIPALSVEEKNYKPETCVWSNDIPKRLVFGPGCKDPGTKRICVGYVICDQKDPAGKFIRMSTCSAANCGDTNEAAVACTKENGYGSRKPSEDASISLGTSVQSIMLKTETVAE